MRAGVGRVVQRLAHRGFIARMPIENERKFVLEDDGTLERRLAARPGTTRDYLRQAYLDASGLRIRSMERAGRMRHVFTYKRPVDDQMVEDRGPRSPAGRLRSGCGSFQGARPCRRPPSRGTTAASTGMSTSSRPTTAAPTSRWPKSRCQKATRCRRRHRAERAYLVLLLAPRNDPRFTSKRLSDRGHAEQLLADVREKGEAA